MPSDQLMTLVLTELRAIEIRHRERLASGAPQRRKDDSTEQISVSTFQDRIDAVKQRNTR